ncbi:MAG: hypothetical protein A2W27_01930 [Deltaproteobacteria bacterium RBG_16_44_11]|nr:MAG: hypothetical protein A2W27_01930 [Deltaproteobacteria bacterium RBG_16_44_11]
MKKKLIPINQYASDTKNLEGATDKFLKKTAPLIGYIVHNFNTLEERLNSAICELFIDDLDSLGLQVIYKRNYADKVDLFKRLLLEEQQCLGGMPSLEEFISKLTEAGRLRNLVVHADWESSHDDGYTLCKLIINKKGIQHEYVQFSPESLKDILDLIIETYNMFEQYEDEHQEQFNSIKTTPST